MASSGHPGTIVGWVCGVFKATVFMILCYPTGPLSGLPDQAIELLGRVKAEAEF
jgi:hypothetical protein